MVGGLVKDQEVGFVAAQHGKSNSEIIFSNQSKL